MERVLRRTLLCLALFASVLPAAAKNEWLTYVGTYTRANGGKGIYAWRFDADSGKFAPIGLAAETSNPSFLVVDARNRFLYAANEDARFQGQSAGAVSAFAIDNSTGKLKFLNQVSSKGPGPCHVVLDRSGKWLFVANYNSGSFAVFPVQSDGKLGEASAFVQHKGSSINRERQRGPHAHDVVISADNRFVFVVDLGLDQIVTYKFDAAKGTVTPNDPPYTKVTAGFGPRHMAFGPKDRFAYLLSEMIVNVTTFRYDAKTGRMEELQTVPSPPADHPADTSGAEIAVHPRGRFVYTSNRGHNSISIFEIDQSKGTLTPRGNVSSGGKTPRNFAIDPTGAYLLAANQDSNNIVVFRIDQKTGALTPTGDSVEAPAPVCVVFAKP